MMGMVQVADRGRAGGRERDSTWLEGSQPQHRLHKSFVASGLFSTCHSDRTAYFFSDSHLALAFDDFEALWVFCMAARNAGRPWTPLEDHQLTQAVHAYGENSDWKTIASHVSNRTNKACRKVRFLLPVSQATRLNSFLSFSVLSAMASFFIANDQEVCLDPRRG